LWGNSWKSFFRGKLFEKSFPHPSKTFTAFLGSTLFGRKIHLLSIGGALRFGKSLDAVQTLLDFSLLYADGAIAPASVLVPPPKTLRKVSLRSK
jgi:hypothetical protein